MCTVIDHVLCVGVIDSTFPTEYSSHTVLRFLFIYTFSTVYMPPEALNENSTYNERIDIYSFGILLVSCLL